MKSIKVKEGIKPEFNHEVWWDCHKCGLKYDARSSTICDSCGYDNQENIQKKLSVTENRKSIRITTGIFNSHKQKIKWDNLKDL